LAKALGIPAVLGVENALQTIPAGSLVAVDGGEGQVVVDPDPQTVAQFQAQAAKHRAMVEQTRQFLPLEPVTADGTRVQLHLNIGSEAPAELEALEHADGVGLFRTEFLYMKYDHLPSEDEQFWAYRAVAERCGERPVVIRTLDVGGDKQLPCMELPKEDNPFLGLRALRLSFDKLDVFRSQIRAALRASAHGRVWIMFPMVGSLGDFRFAKKLVRQFEIELRAENQPVGEYKLGVMVEIPSIAMMADVVAQEADFASIGTNDLCQYLTAVDRLNPRVAKYYQSYHPALFRMVAQVVTAFDALDKPISLCGELAGEALAIPVLIGLGLRKLSMSPGSLAPAKQVIRQLNTNRARRMANTVLGLSTAGQVEAFLKSEAAEPAEAS
jgi:phosphotransferase system enzyme I (PtsI)